jgi:hypothetical protein
MQFDPSPLTEKEWSRLKTTALSAIIVGLVRVARDIGTEAIRRRLGWEDDPDDDDGDGDGGDE